MPRKPRVLKGYVPTVGEFACFRQVKTMIDVLVLSVDHELKQAQIRYYFYPTNSTSTMETITRWVPFARLVRKAAPDDTP